MASSKLLFSTSRSAAQSLLLLIGTQSCQKLQMTRNSDKQGGGGAHYAQRDCQQKNCIEDSVLSTSTIWDFAADIILKRNPHRQRLRNLLEFAA